jgi:phosphatidylglycerophosphate synthase
VTSPTLALRLATVTLVIIALANPVLGSAAPAQGALVVLLDQSDSLGDAGKAALRAQAERLIAEHAGPSSVVAFGANAVAAPPGDADAIVVRDRVDLAAAERTLRSSIIKPTDGRMGRFNRRMSIPISVALIRLTRCSANAMSVFLIALGLYAGWLFSLGTYTSGIVAALVSLAASILDGCDGELARLQYADSKFGVWLDTLGDYSYYLAIFGGLTVGAVQQTQSTGFWWIGGAAMCGSLLTFALLILLRQRITRGRPERLRSTAQSHFERRGTRWTALAARLSTVATRATMPYGVLAFALAGALPALLVLAAIGANVYWVCLLIESGRLLARDSGLQAAT